VFGESCGVDELFDPADVVTVPGMRASTLRLLLEGVGADLSDVDREEVVQQSCGNPMWARELAAARLSGHLSGVPKPITDALRDQVTALPAPVQALLEMVTVLGTASAACLIGAGVTDASTLELAVQRNVVHQKDDDLTAARPLLGAAAVELLGNAGRLALHRQAAALPIDSIRQAEHEDRARSLGPDEDLALVLVAAARRARTIGATDTAHQLLIRALSRTAAGSRSWSQRVLDAATAAYAAGRLADVVALLDRIEPTDLPVHLLDLGVDLMSDAMHQVHGMTWVFERAEQLQSQLPVQSARWDLVEVTRIASAGLNVPDAAEKLAATVKRINPAVTPRAAHTARAWQIVLGVDAGDGLDTGLLDQQRHFEKELAPGAVRASAMDLEAEFAYQCDDLDRSQERLPGVVRHSRAVGDVSRLAEALGHATVVAVLSGSLRAAAKLRDEAVEATESLVHPPAALQRARGLLALALDDRSTLREVLDGDLPPALEARAALLTKGLRGLDAAYSADWERALPLLEEVWQRAEARGIREPGRRLWVDVELGRALVHSGELDRARFVATSLAELGARAGRVHARGQGQRIAALIALREGDAVSALAGFDRAVADLRRGGFLLELLRTEAERYEALTALDRQQDARIAHAEALTTAKAVGDRRVVRTFERLATMLTGDSLSSLLTAAERRVAGAVASGKSNREIASTFFLSVRTVEAQLTSIYRKTGIHTRTQLALRVLEEGVAERSALLA
jgi:DNA-binding CsgD family transcriptional regulator